MKYNKIQYYRTKYITIQKNEWITTKFNKLKQKKTKYKTTQLITI